MLYRSIAVWHWEVILINTNENGCIGSLLHSYFSNQKQSGINPSNYLIERAFGFVVRAVQKVYLR